MQATRERRIQPTWVCLPTWTCDQHWSVSYQLPTNMDMWPTDNLLQTKLGGWFQRLGVVVLFRREPKFIFFGCDGIRDGIQKICPWKHHPETIQDLVIGNHHLTCCGWKAKLAVRMGMIHEHRGNNCPMGKYIMYHAKCGEFNGAF